MTAIRKREITRADILPMAEYAARRRELRSAVVALKKPRRLEVGPVATFYFECFETMLQQVQEMLYIEKGGEEQVADELRAYNPLIPQGRELVATVMFEIDDPVRRANFLARLGGVEHTAFLKFAGETVKGVPEADQDRTNESGKASSVQFIHFPMSDAQAALFKQQDQQVVIGFEHPAYGHMAMMSEASRQALAGDLD
ncbi:uncharacterized protein DUF3501 [Dongia mobilis]|uniref:Uncharacterized protein DUF3501 n=1 Tax=Dongia mobilis TaxID=578943 RepID=A0A4R6WWA7_9PROT|nr:DUF3501 family protein [Dongia mobilis]TDQ86363.1 uncharacterized protein DUF3501 [Dongia mobilis]